MELSAGETGEKVFEEREFEEEEEEEEDEKVSVSFFSLLSRRERRKKHAHRMENRAHLLWDASMEASPSPSVYAKGNGAAREAAAAPEQEQGLDGGGDMRGSRGRRIPSRNPREQRSPWTAPRARKTRRRGDHLEEHHACRVAAGAPGAPQTRDGEREREVTSIAKPTTTTTTRSSFRHLKTFLLGEKKTHNR